jgi:hypothetical protein
MDQEDQFLRAFPSNEEPHERLAQSSAFRAEPDIHSADDHTFNPLDDAQSNITELQRTLDFIKLLQNASLDASGLAAETIAALRNPMEGVPDLDNNPGLKLSIELFMALNTASRETYKAVCDAIIRCFPEIAEELYSYDAIKKKIAEITGVVPLLNHMCPNSCAAYTGPLSLLEQCPYCNASRWDEAVLRDTLGKKKVPAREFFTIPVGPQLQALWRSKESATALQYKRNLTEKVLAEISPDGTMGSDFVDFFSGMEYVQAVQDGRITEDDMVLVFSIDGAQLYRSKASDCWIYIWVVYDLDPSVRYKKRYVLPGGFIGGPEKPKNVDSYIFPGLYHVSALQKEGVGIWDANSGRVFKSTPFLALGTADGPGLTHLNGLVGHQGAFGCRLFCGTKGRRKAGAPTYYPAGLKPDDFHVQGSDHPDVDIMNLGGTSEAAYQANLQHILSSPNETQYKQRKTETGIVKPSLYSGLGAKGTLGVPRCFPIDLMHLITLNIPDLLTALWRGILPCYAPDDKSSWDWAVLTGATWQDHGVAVAKATPYLPGSFDRPPRNPAEKISSGYKAWEFLLYIFGLCPALLWKVLPYIYWRHFCKLVYCVRILHQHIILMIQVLEVHRLLREYVLEYEELYYQRKAERLHFCRPSIHALAHLAAEVVRLGPPAYYTQWCLERTIGNLGQEVKQPSNPYANISHRGLLRAQTNALGAMYPSLGLGQESKLPRYSESIGDGYVLLRARDRRPQSLSATEMEPIARYFEHFGEIAPSKITRWARLLLPTGQVARSAWKEGKKPLEKVRMARNVKVSINLTCKRKIKADHIYLSFA